MSESDPAPIRVVRNARARRMRLSIDRITGEARLTLPPRASERAGLAWASEHGDWIASQRARVPAAAGLSAGARIMLDDQPLVIVHAPELGRRIAVKGDELRCGGPAERVAARVERWLRGEALRLLSADSATIAARAGVHLTGVSVGDPRARWGSCSASGAIRYSWRLALAPAWVRRAIVAHEVAHRLHMDHSPAFRAAEAELSDGKAKAATRWLSANGVALMRIGRG